MARVGMCTQKKTRGIIVETLKSNDFRRFRATRRRRRPYANAGKPFRVRNAYASTGTPVRACICVRLRVDHENRQKMILYRNTPFLQKI